VKGSSYAFSPSFCHFPPPNSNYSPQQLVFELFQAMYSKVRDQVVYPYQATHSSVAHSTATNNSALSGCISRVAPYRCARYVVLWCPTPSFCEHHFNYTKQIHNTRIYSLHAFYCIFTTYFVVIFTIIRENLCALYLKPHSITHPFYGYCSSCVPIYKRCNFVFTAVTLFVQRSKSSMLQNCAKC
jgi:hypothetical protein